MATMKPYILDDAATVEYQRLDLMSKILDPWTRDYLRSLGVGPGWNCLELGPGNGSITEWLCAAVGSTGGPCCVRPGPASMVSMAWSGALASAVAVDVPAHRGQWSIAEEHLATAQNAATAVRSTQIAGAVAWHAVELAGARDDHARELKTV